MSTVEKVNIFSDGEENSTVTNCKFLVVLITNDSYTNEETNKRIKLEQSSNGKIDKNHKILGSFNQHKSSAIVDNSLSSSAVWVKRKADKRKNDDTMDSKKDECISD
jgi:hypothetical protein